MCSVNVMMTLTRIMRKTTALFAFVLLSFFFRRVYELRTKSLGCRSVFLTQIELDKCFFLTRKCFVLTLEKKKQTKTERQKEAQFFHSQHTFRKDGPK